MAYENRDLLIFIELRKRMLYLPDFIVPIIRIVGDFCNLRCRYCFYREHDQASPLRMKGIVLERAIREVIQYNISKGNSKVEFVWHGGEPLLAGIDFFKKVVEIQRHFSGVDIINSVQTNATLIDERWARFFVQHRFHIGVSLDGLPEIHNRYRIDIAGQGSWEEAVRGYQWLRTYGLTPGIIVVVHVENAAFVRTMVKYLYYELNARRIAFNPFMSVEHPLNLTPQKYQQFLKDLVSVWLEIGDPSFAIREVDDFLNLSQGIMPAGCIYDGRCAHYLSIQPNGNVYPCSRLPFTSEFLFGNLVEHSLLSILENYRYQRFVEQVADFPQSCQGCALLEQCHNGCTALRVKGKYYYCNVRREIPQWIDNKIGFIISSFREASYER